MQNKLISLILKLTSINLAIESEHKSRAPNWMRLFRLKRIRLMIKDRIQAFKTLREGKKAVRVNAREPRRYVPVMALARMQKNNGGRA
ncbi:MAG: hypothetical protein EBQ96_00865 [Proteobacteria bacterium]|nr:hypothetical protein [Pseudomonadota bacterium]